MTEETRKKAEKEGRGEKRAPEKRAFALEYRAVTFAYPGDEGAAPDDSARGAAPAPDDSARGAAPAVLRGCDLAIPQGAFCLLAGDTGSGKTTLLRLAKPEIAPAGSLSGSVRALGRDVRALTPLESAQTVGYVFQSPDNQIVCDTVWHEMAFGLENLAVPETEMRRRVAEVCYFFGMERWFHAKTSDLSGGQRQVLALAATLVMRPRVLLLDEPTSMLDPIAEKGFASLLFRVNRELGVTVVVATHAPVPLVPFASMALRVEAGRVSPVDLSELRKVSKSDFSLVKACKGMREACKEVRSDPCSPAQDPAHAPSGSAPAHPAPAPATPGATPDSAAAHPPCVRLRGAWFRYHRDAPWVLRGCDLAVAAGEVRALVGGNASGKSTLLSLVAGIVRPQRGRAENAAARSQALLPQNPKALLSKESVEEELMEWAPTVGYGREDMRRLMGELAMADVPLARHPYDLSGGQQQLLALAKLLLTRPRLLLLDEPTKGLDAAARRAVAESVCTASARGVTVVMATHDLAFARAVASSVSMLFDGGVTLTEPTEEFFERSWLWGDR